MTNKSYGWFTHRHRYSHCSLKSSRSDDPTSPTPASGSCHPCWRPRPWLFFASTPTLSNAFRHRRRSATRSTRIWGAIHGPISQYYPLTVGGFAKASLLSVLRHRRAAFSSIHYASRDGGPSSSQNALRQDWSAGQGLVPQVCYCNAGRPSFVVRLTAEVKSPVQPEQQRLQHMIMFT